MSCPDCKSENFIVESYQWCETQGGNEIIEANCECQDCFRLYQRQFVSEEHMRNLENHS